MARSPDQLRKEPGVKLGLDLPAHLLPERNYAFAQSVDHELYSPGLPYDEQAAAAPRSLDRQEAGASR